jgi:hypothetical protein
MVRPIAAEAENVPDRNSPSGSIGLDRRGFHEHERARRQPGQPEPEQHRRGAEPVPPAVDHRDRQRDERDHRRQLPGQIHPARPRPARLGRVPVGEQDAGQPDRRVDEEHRPPAQRGREQAADQRPDREGRRRAGRPQPDRAGPTGRVRVHVGEQAERARHQHGRPAALHRPSRDQRRRRRRQPAGGRGEGEHREPGGEHPPRADPVAERTGAEDQRRERDRVRVHHPLQPSHAAAEIRADRLDRDVDHAHVELHDGEPEAGREQRPAASLDLPESGHSEPR